MGHSKYRFLIPGKPSPFLIAEWFIFAGSATTLSVHPPPRAPVPTLVQLPGPRTAFPLQHEALATCLRPVAAGAEPAGLVLLRRRAPPQTQARGQGRGGKGLRAWNALAKTKGGPGGRRAAQLGLMSPQLRGSGRWRRRAPPAAGRCGRCSGSRSFSTGRRANTATCLWPRRERKSSHPTAAAAAAGKTRAGARTAPRAPLPAATTAGTRARAHAPLQFYLLPSSASRCSPQVSLPSRQPELGGCVIDGSS